MRKLSLGLSTIAAMFIAGASYGQVTINMPPPPVPPLEVDEVEPVQPEVTVGDVAFYRYASVRVAPQRVTPRFYQQDYLLDYPPYYFHGVAGKRFLPPPAKVRFVWPHPFQGFSLRLH